MFSTDFVFRQQENLVDNLKCQVGIQATMQQNTNFAKGQGFYATNLFENDDFTHKNFDEY